MKIETANIATLNTKPIVEWRPGQRTIVVNAEPNPDPDQWIEETNRAASPPAKPRLITKSFLSGFQKYHEALAPRN